jgi:hypothetical protein
MRTAPEGPGFSACRVRGLSRWWCRAVLRSYRTCRSAARRSRISTMGLRTALDFDGDRVRDTAGGGRGADGAHLLRGAVERQPGPEPKDPADPACVLDHAPPPWRGLTAKDRTSTSWIRFAGPHPGPAQRRPPASLRNKRMTSGLTWRLCDATVKVCAGLPGTRANGRSLG